MAVLRPKCLGLTEAVPFSTVLNPTEAWSHTQWDGVNKALKGAWPGRITNACRSAQHWVPVCMALGFIEAAAAGGLGGIATSCQPAQH